MNNINNRILKMILKLTIIYILLKIKLYIILLFIDIIIYKLKT